MNPGPAISTVSTWSVSGSYSMIAAARSRGLRRAGLASRIATFEAKLPCVASRVRSTVLNIDRSPTASASSGSLASASPRNCAIADFMNEALCAARFWNRRRF